MYFEFHCIYAILTHGYYKNRKKKKKKKKKEEDKNEKENILVLNNCATYCFTYV